MSKTMTKSLSFSIRFVQRSQPLSPSLFQLWAEVFGVCEEYSKSGGPVQARVPGTFSGRQENVRRELSTFQSRGKPRRKKSGTYHCHAQGIEMFSNENAAAERYYRLRV